MDQGLKGALGLVGPEACLAYYRDWAANYDQGFATEMQYLLPSHVAAAFCGTRAEGRILDVGAGTGLLAEALRQMGISAPIDAVDFSAEMLAQAAEKAIYAGLHQADITRPLALPHRYGGIVSSGTFTAGHVGPEALPHLLAIALPKAQFALSINRRVWTARGFDMALARLVAQGRISDLHQIEVEIYGAAAARIDTDHAQDRALVVLFRAI
ncbi:MAG: class I SAM-dependent methyltransferase [Tabrizicola sp.]|jgi:SAM-dependent methyltransferase|nr:class I SAM-dependent methyltransferase [Tabrizicola sp.]